MSAAPRTTQQQVHTAPRGHSIAHFIKFLYDRQHGYFEVCGIAGDPLTQPLKRLRWIQYAPERVPEITKYLLECVDRYGNIYISRTLYSRKQRSRAYARPSRNIFIDDAPEHLDLIPSAVIRTSAGSLQVHYRLEHEADAATISDLQHRAAHALRADKSGADIEQLVRIPESFNGKNGGQYAVHTESISPRTYTVEQLRNQWPEVANLDAPSATIDWNEVERWLGNSDLMFNANGIPWRFKNPDGQGRRLLEGKLTPLKPDGQYDPSMARAILIKSCIYHHYEDAVIAAIAMRMSNFNQDSTKNTNSIKADVARLIGKYRQQHPNIEPTPIKAYPAKAPQPIPEIEPARNGRPPRLTDDAYYARLRKLAIGASGAIMENQSEAAAACGVSVATIRRIEKRLQTDGLIKRRTVRKKAGTYSYVVLYSTIKTLENVASMATDPAGLVRSADAENVRNHAEIQTSEGSKKEHTPLIAPADDAAAPENAAPRSLMEGVEWAIAVLRATGTRVTWQRVRGWLQENVPDRTWPDAKIKNVYRAMLQREKRLIAADFWQQMREMSLDGLLKRRKNLDTRIGAPKKSERLSRKQLLSQRRIVDRVIQEKIAASKAAYPVPEPPTPTEDIAPTGACVPLLQPEVLAQPVYAVQPPTVGLVIAANYYAMRQARRERERVGVA